MLGLEFMVWLERTFEGTGVTMRYQCTKTLSGVTRELVALNIPFSFSLFGTEISCLAYPKEQPKYTFREEYKQFGENYAKLSTIQENLAYYALDLRAKNT